MIPCVRLLCVIYSSPSIRRLSFRSLSPPAKVVEGHVGRLDDVIGDERGPLACALLGALHTALPFEDRPPTVVVLGKEREDAFKVYLAVAEGPEPPGATVPVLISAVDTDATVGVELRIFDVERPNALVVELDEMRIVELLQQEVARVVGDADRRMLIDLVEEHLEGGPVIEIGAGMELVAEGDTPVAGVIENGPPTRGELREGLVNDSLRPLGPRVDHVPGEAARHRGDVAGAEVHRCIDRLLELIGCPFGNLSRLSAPSGGTPRTRVRMPDGRRAPAPADTSRAR